MGIKDKIVLPVQAKLMENSLNFSLKKKKKISFPPAGSFFPPFLKVS